MVIHCLAFVEITKVLVKIECIIKPCHRVVVVAYNSRRLRLLVIIYSVGR